MWKLFWVRVRCWCSPILLDWGIGPQFCDVRKTRIVRPDCMLHGILLRWRLYHNFDRCPAWLFSRWYPSVESSLESAVEKRHSYIKAMATIPRPTITIFWRAQSEGVPSVDPPFWCPFSIGMIETRKLWRFTEQLRKAIVLRYHPTLMIHFDICVTEVQMKRLIIGRNRNGRSACISAEVVDISSL